MRHGPVGAMLYKSSYEQASDSLCSCTTRTRRRPSCTTAWRACCNAPALFRMANRRGRSDAAIQPLWVVPGQLQDPSITCWPRFSHMLLAGQTKEYEYVPVWRWGQRLQLPLDAVYQSTSRISANKMQIRVWLVTARIQELHPSRESSLPSPRLAPSKQPKPPQIRRATQGTHV